MAQNIAEEVAKQNVRPALRFMVLGPPHWCCKRKPVSPRMMKFSTGDTAVPILSRPILTTHRYRAGLFFLPQNTGGGADALGFLLVGARRSRKRQQGRVPRFLLHGGVA